MKIEDVLKEPTIDKKIQLLQSQRGAPVPKVTEYKDQWNPCDHKINNPALRPDKQIKVPSPDNPENMITKTEKVNRVALAIQKLIVKRAAAFLFGNPVVVQGDPASDQETSVMNAVTRILSDAKIDSRNRTIARELFATTEVAEYWYPVQAAKPSNGYGFSSPVKMKMNIFSPLRGDLLYPFFDDNGDMVAFSRQFTVTDASNASVEYFETWTSTLYQRWKRGNGGSWVLDMPADAQEGIMNQVGKIPVIYARQEQVDWADVQTLIDRLEKLFSNFGDTNDYHGAPKIFVNGEIKGWSAKGESGAIIEGDRDAKAEYLSWDQAPESVKLEFDSLMRMIYSITQTPDISFESVKGIGSAASGQGLKMLFLDAHLKVMDKMEIFDDYLQRRLNLLKAYVGQLSKTLEGAADTLNLTPVVTPFMIGDDATTIANLVDAVGGGILSKETAVMHNPYVTDAAQEMDRLQEESDAINSDPAGLDNIQNEE